MPANQSQQHSRPRLTSKGQYCFADIHRQCRPQFDVANYASTTVNASGVVVNTATGGQWRYKATKDSATLGAELITNGTFATGLSGWADSGSSWSWSAGTALHTAGSVSTLSQSVSVTSGGTYQVQFTMSGRTAGSISVTLGSVNCYPVGSSAKFHQHFATHGLLPQRPAPVALTITPTSDFDGSLDDITVKEVTLGSFSPIVILMILQGFQQ